MSDGPLQSILALVTEAVEPLRVAATDPDALRVLVARLDPALVMDAPTATAMQQALRAVPGLLDDLASTVDAAVDGDASALVDLGVVVTALVAVVTDAASVVAEGSFGLQAPYDSAAHWATLLQGLLPALLADLLADEVPAAYGIAAAVGVIEELDGGGVVVHLDRLGDLLDPATALATATGWGSGVLDAEVLVARLSTLFGSTGVPVRVVHPDADVVALLGGVDQPAEARVVEVPVVSGLLAGGAGAAEAGLLLGIVARSPGGPLDSLLVSNLSFGSVAAATAVDDDWSVVVGGTAEASATLGVLLGPWGVEPRNAGAETSLSLELHGERPTGSFTPVGNPTGTRLEVGHVDVGIALETGGADAELVVWAVLGDALLAVAAGDTLLRTLFGADELGVPFSLELRWSTADGFTLGGTVGLSVRIPLDVRIGPVLLDAVDVEAGVDGDAVALSATVDVSAELGPFAIAIDGVGLAARIGPTPDGDGLLGSLDLGVALVPPTVLALSMTAPMTGGGGLVAIDPDSGRYAGAFAIELATIGVQAVVIADTELGGDPGWALFASVSATFTPGLPIGFGFSITGVGGLVALNRTIDIDELALGMRTGAADAILFPTDPVADAGAILENLDHWFPVLADNVVFGPMIELSWGAPARLVSGQLGVLVSLPDLVVALIGSIHVALPDPAAPVLDLHLDLLGAVDASAGTVLITASLYDSTLLGTISLAGDMAFHLSLSGQPSFVLSVGGYHPGWQPPGDLPAAVLGLRRMRAGIDLADDVNISFHFYVAITSNTVQFGGGVDLTASVKVLGTTYTAVGWFGFNVLLVLRPFKIIADVSAGVTVSTNRRELMGVDLRLDLQGPDPWFAIGRAEFRFFGVDVSFRVEIGSTTALDARVTADVLGPVLEAIDADDAWSVVDDIGSWASGVITGSVDAGAGLVVRPDQLVEVRQRVAPLGRVISAFGVFDPEQTIIDLGEVTVGGSPGAHETIEDWFAPAQFDRLGDDAKLSQPSFELETAGVRIGESGVAVEAAAANTTTISTDHEQSIHPDAPGVRRPGIGVTPPPRVGRRRRVTGQSFTVPPAPGWAVVDAAGAVVATATRHVDAVALAADRHAVAVPATAVELAGVVGT